MPLADDLVISLPGANVSLVVVNGVASQAVSLVVELHSAVGDVCRSGSGIAKLKLDDPHQSHS